MSFVRGIVWNRIRALSVRYAVLSDVHGNLPALEAAVKALQRKGVDRWIHAGDAVGYGPWPNECVRLLESLDAIAVAGNHDLAVLGRLDVSRYHRIARRLISWTQSVLADDTREWLDALPLRADAHRVVVAHGSLDDPTEYVRTRERAARDLARVDPAATLVLGHTHVPWWYDRRLLNPGAVGQTRDERVVARVALLNPDERAADLREVRYDVGRVRRELWRRGLPFATYRWPPPLTARIAARFLTG